MVDVGYARASMDTPVYEFIKSSAGSIYKASKGFGSSGGQMRYRHPTSRGHGRRLGNHWFATWQPDKKTWLYNADADYWKNFVHTALLTDSNRPGSLSLFGRMSEAVVHNQYARQITAEIWTRGIQAGQGRRLALASDTPAEPLARHDVPVMRRRGDRGDENHRGRAHLPPPVHQEAVEKPPSRRK